MIFESQWIDAPSNIQTEFLPGYVQTLPFNANVLQHDINLNLSNVPSVQKVSKTPNEAQATASLFSRKFSSENYPFAFHCISTLSEHVTIIKSNFIKKYKTIVIPATREWLQIIKLSVNINHTDFNSSSFDKFSCKASVVNYSPNCTTSYIYLIFFDELSSDFIQKTGRIILNLMINNNNLFSSSNFLGFTPPCLRAIFFSWSHCCIQFVLLLYSFRICKPTFALKC